MKPASQIIRRGFFGIYLLLYPLPWLATGTGPIAIVAFFAGATLFMVLPALTAGLNAPVIWRIAGYAAIGTALIPFGGYWGVFFISAGATCGAIENRRHGLALLIASMIVYLLLGIRVHETVIGEAITLIVTTGSFAGTRMAVDLNRQNIALARAQAEIRALTLLAERERFARDLHDTLGHSLTLIAMKSDLALRYIPQGPNLVEQELREIGEKAREALAETRFVVSAMQIRTLTEECASGTATLRNAGIEVEIDGDIASIPSRYDNLLAGCLRESITNILRHTKAVRCAVSFTRSLEGKYRITIEDFSVSHVGPARQNIDISLSFREGNGISGMRARLAEAGGSLDLLHRQDGTTLVITLGDAS